MLAEQVHGLSPAQLEYKASPDRWSIREVVSHLAVAEPDYWREIKEALKAAPDMKDKKSTATDADILLVRHRSGRACQDRRRPRKVDTYKDAWRGPRKISGASRHHDRLHQDHKRRHARPQPESRADRLLAMDAEISTHAERHIQQIRRSRTIRTFQEIDRGERRRHSDYATAIARR